MQASRLQVQCPFSPTPPPLRQVTWGARVTDQVSTKRRRARPFRAGPSPAGCAACLPLGAPQESTGLLEGLGVCVSLSIQARFPSLAFNVLMDELSGSSFSLSLLSHHVKGSLIKALQLPAAGPPAPRCSNTPSLHVGTGPIVLESGKQVLYFFFIK